jgi:hypothetical protein
MQVSEDILTDMQPRRARPATTEEVASTSVPLAAATASPRGKRRSKGRSTSDALVGATAPTPTEPPSLTSSALMPALRQRDHQADRLAEEFVRSWPGPRPPSWQQIADHLNELGVMTPRSGPWNDRKVRSTLSYRGFDLSVVWGSREV